MGDASLNDSSLRSLVSSHPAVIEFKRGSNCEALRQVLRINDGDLPYNLTRSTLFGPNMISKEPFVYTNDDVGSLIAFYQLSSKLAGHSKIVHGRLAAVLLDECMGRSCFPRLVGRIAVTAKLDLSYKSPIQVDSVVMIRAETIEVQGRKARVHARVEDAREGTLLVEAEGLFIEPKWAVEIPKVI